MSDSNADVISGLNRVGRHDLADELERLILREKQIRTQFRRAEAKRVAEARAADFSALGITGLHAMVATPEDLRRAYREKAKAAHPDGGGSVEQFNELRRHYEAALRSMGAQP